MKIEDKNDEIDKKQVGLRIKGIRLALGETAEKFGNRFDPPANRGLVSGWENGRYLPSPDRLKIIAELGEIPVPTLVYGVEDEGLSNYSLEQLIKKYPNIHHIIERIVIKIIDEIEKPDYLSNETIEAIKQETILLFFNSYFIHGLSFGNRFKFSLYNLDLEDKEDVEILKGYTKTYFMELFKYYSKENGYLLYTIDLMQDLSEGLQSFKRDLNSKNIDIPPVAEDVAQILQDANSKIFKLLK